MMLTTAYLTLALATAAVGFIVGTRLADEHCPLAQRIGLSLAAGVVWSVVLLGCIEMGSFAAGAKVWKLVNKGRRVASWRRPVRARESSSY